MEKDQETHEDEESDSESESDPESETDSDEGSQFTEDSETIQSSELTQSLSAELTTAADFEFLPASIVYLGQLDEVDLEISPPNKYSEVVLIDTINVDDDSDESSQSDIFDYEREYYETELPPAELSKGMTLPKKPKPLDFQHPRSYWKREPLRPPIPKKVSTSSYTVPSPETSSATLPAALPALPSPSPAPALRLAPSPYLRVKMGPMVSPPPNQLVSLFPPPEKRSPPRKHSEKPLTPQPKKQQAAEKLASLKNVPEAKKTPEPKKIFELKKVNGAKKAPDVKRSSDPIKAPAPKKTPDVKKSSDLKKVPAPKKAAAKGKKKAPPVAKKVPDAKKPPSLGASLKTQDTPKEPEMPTAILAKGTLEDLPSEVLKVYQ
ncbi:histone H1E-like [Varroa jacobsoni]|nr:histone H1E-like [Varroa jacobsoni]